MEQIVLPVNFVIGGGGEVRELQVVVECYDDETARKFAALKSAAVKFGLNSWSVGGGGLYARGAETPHRYEAVEGAATNRMRWCVVS